MKAVPTINDVAEKAGVSIATVSRVLNQTVSVRSDLRDRVLAAVEETGYRANPIASSLKSTRRNQIAIVIPTLRRTYYTDIIKGISDICYDQHIIPMILESDGIFEKEEQLISALELQWVDGIILLPGCKAEPKVYQAYADRLSKLKKGDVPIPVLIVDSPEINPELDMVCADFNGSFYRMTEHLIEIGRRNLIFIGNAASVPLFELAKGGIDRALHEVGMTMPEEAELLGNYTVMDGYHAMKEYIASGKKADGVICMNDQVAAGALEACREEGLEIPRDMALIGFGGVAMSIVTEPSISSICIPRYEIGQEAIRLLLERINGERTEVSRVVFPGNLSIRESTMKSARKTMDVLFYESKDHGRG